MTAGSKIIRGLREALSFARGDCQHEWVELVNIDLDDTSGKWACAKCSVIVFSTEPPKGAPNV